jgi:hypothetical protein
LSWVELEKEIEKLEKYLKKNLLSEIIKILEKSTNYISYQKNN